MKLEPGTKLDKRTKKTSDADAISENCYCYCYC